MRSIDGAQTEILELTKLAAPRRMPAKCLPQRCPPRGEPANDAPPRHAAFGEFLVENRVLDRYQLFRALQLQDRMPGVRLGHCAVALGYAPRAAIEQLHVQFVQNDEAQIEDIDLESMTTDAFERDPEIDIQYRNPPR